MNARIENLPVKSAKSVIPRDFVVNPPAVGDRVTFNTPDDGVLAGFVSAFRSHLGNGEVFAWVELDHQWQGLFRGVPLRDIESADGFGRGLDLGRSLATGNFREQYLCDFSSHATRYEQPVQPAQRADAAQIAAFIRADPRGL